MPLRLLTIDRFRNLAPVTIECSPRLNLFLGANAAGKTSLLEAVYVLGRARSFRTSSLEKAIQSGCDEFRLVAQVVTATGRDIPVGMSKSKKQLIARIDGKPVKRLSDLAALFPLQWVGGNLHRLLEEGPLHRRQYLDWGMFHVKQSYIPVWQRLHKLLKQRNAALRTGRSAAEIEAWDGDLSRAGEELHALRSDYLVELEAYLQNVTAELLPLPQPVEIRYRRGWASEESYLQALKAALPGDRERGYTRAGPHRADVVFHYAGQPASEQLSRGQQKLLVIALQLAQARLLKAQREQSSLFLIDDLGAELDQENQMRVMRLLSSVEAQVFATAIEMPNISGWDSAGMKRFHVKHGTIVEVI